MNRLIGLATGMVLILIITILYVARARPLAESGDAPSLTQEEDAARSSVDDGSAAAPEKADTRRDVLINARHAPAAPALAEGTWINSSSLTLKELRGSVVLVDFWTFGCYNCRNTLPALKRFDELYSKQGLTIVGVHAPETDYEKDLDSVRRQVVSLGIRYPVVTDNGYETWRAYNVEAWPTVVILDRQGRIRYTHIGEGQYEEQETIIKKLLAE